MRSALLVFAACLLLAGCSAAPAPATVVDAETLPPAPVGTEGVYDLDFGQFTGVYVIVDGEFWGLHFLGDTLAGHPHGVLSAANTALDQEPIAWANFVDDGRRVGTMESSGTLGRSFTADDLTVAITGSMGSFSAKATMQKAYADGSAIFSAPRPVDGDYAGVVRTVGIEHKQEDAAVSIAPDGGFAVTAVGCTLTGTLVAREGLFDAIAETSGAGCLLQPSLTGIAVPLGDGSLAIELDTADAAQSAVFILHALT